MKVTTLICIVAMILVLAIASPAQKSGTGTGGPMEFKDTTAPAPAVIPAPVEKRLTWENHRLRSANLGLQIENLRTQQALENQAAEKVLAEMQASVGDKYQPRVNQEGLLEFALKPVEPPKPK